MTPLRALRPTSPCPCSSGKSYRECCQPLHKGVREGDAAADVVRARYAAYAVGDADFLWKTLHPRHEDKALPEELAKRSLSETAKTFKYTGLAIASEDVDGDVAFVRFHAKVFERGRDHSFDEVSRFERTAEGWRYVSGEITRADKK
ncbi:MAG TPA: YchJ family metal-binding protein [Polyangiaceae bacterium]|jgi:SEC-C motif-containing protein|nr:YchJ family metal-binding protein [Polyangiaceae bacterium]